MTNLGIFTKSWNEMPKTATFDELIASSGYANYAEGNGLWKIILKNGCYYTQDRDNGEIGRLCRPLQVIDKCSLAGYGQR